MFFPPPASNLAIQIDPAKGIRVAQIICVALILGLVTFTCVTLIMNGQAKPPLISFVALGVGALQIVLRFVLPGIVIRPQLNNLKDLDQRELDSRLFAAFQTKMIIGLALLEGAGFFNLVGYMVERQWWTLALVGLLLLLMAMMFPTLSQFEGWADEQKRELSNQF